MSAPSTIIAFAGDVCIASGELSCVALAAKKAVTKARHKTVLLFNASTSEPVEIDLRGSCEDVLARLPPPPIVPDGADAADKAEAPRRAGRPRLGVISREVTLLPRHWDWLGSQPGGASVALRKLVEHAMRANAGKDRIRTSQNAAYKFMSVMAGDRAGFEDASRALFTADAQKFNKLISAWPEDIRDHLRTLAADALNVKEPAS
jgi:hypothetical protein